MIVARTIAECEKIMRRQRKAMDKRLIGCIRLMTIRSAIFLGRHISTPVEMAQ